MKAYAGPWALTEGVAPVQRGMGHMKWNMGKAVTGAGVGGSGPWGGRAVRSCRCYILFLFLDES